MFREIFTSIFFKTRWKYPVFNFIQIEVSDEWHNDFDTCYIFCFRSRHQKMQCLKNTVTLYVTPCSLVEIYGLV
jgi:hypothetical protein